MSSPFWVTRLAASLNAGSRTWVSAYVGGPDLEMQELRVSTDVGHTSCEHHLLRGDVVRRGTSFHPGDVGPARREPEHLAQSVRSNPPAPYRRHDPVADLDHPLTGRTVESDAPNDDTAFEDLVVAERV